MKKILIIYASAGVGHMKAALAIKKTFDELHPDGAVAQMIDALDYMTGHFRKSYVSYYLLMIRRLSNLWGLFYFVTNNPYVNVLVARVRRYVNWLHSRRFVAFLLETRPDVVITTHFLANEVVSNLKAKGLINTRLITVVTDYRLHAFWLASNVDLYIVGSEEAAGDFRSFWVRRANVKVLGIPVEPAFTRGLDRERLRDRLNLKKGPLTILAVGGGFGIGPIEKIINILNDVDGSIQALVVCGHNDSLRQRIEALKSGLRTPVSVFGYIDNMHELMSVSDILISKSGGLTATEALAERLPMIILSPIPGQESRNSDFLVSRGAAIKIKGLGELKKRVSGLVSDPAALEAIREAIGRIARPAAARDIVKEALV